MNPVKFHFFNRQEKNKFTLLLILFLIPAAAARAEPEIYLSKSWKNCTIMTLFIWQQDMMYY